MNKLKIEVVNFVNSEVISTSLCDHYTADATITSDPGHYKISNYVNNSVFHVEYYYYDGGELRHYGGYDAASYSQGDITGNGWYYFDGSEYKKCKNQHDDAHPSVDMVP